MAVRFGPRLMLVRPPQERKASGPRVRRESGKVTVLMRV